MDVAKGKTKFLAVKLSALRSELKISREIFNDASREVENMFNSKYFPEVPVKSKEEKEKEIKEYSEEEAAHNDSPSNGDTDAPGPENNREDTTSASKDSDPGVKKMFRKIALKIHPDKLEELSDGFEKNKKQELFEKARQALEDNDILTLSDVAMELGIEVPEITEEKLKQTEKKIISIKNELSQIESTLVWHWFFTNDAAQRDDILKKLFELMYANNPRS